MSVSRLLNPAYLEIGDFRFRISKNAFIKMSASLPVTQQRDLVKMGQAEMYLSGFTYFHVCKGSAGRG